MKRRLFLKLSGMATALMATPVAAASVIKLGRQEPRTREFDFAFDDSPVFTGKVVDDGIEFVGTVNEFPDIKVIADSYDKTMELAQDAAHDLHFYGKKILTYRDTESFLNVWSERNPAELNFILDNGYENGHRTSKYMTYADRGRRIGLPARTTRKLYWHNTAR